MAAYTLLHCIIASCIFARICLASQSKKLFNAVVGPADINVEMHNFLGSVDQANVLNLSKRQRRIHTKKDNLLYSHNRESQRYHQSIYDIKNNNFTFIQAICVYYCDFGNKQESMMKQCSHTFDNNININESDIMTESSLFPIQIVMSHDSLRREICARIQLQDDALINSATKYFLKNIPLDMDPRLEFAQNYYGYPHPFIVATFNLITTTNVISDKYSALFTSENMYAFTKFFMKFSKYYDSIDSNFVTNTINLWQQVLTSFGSMNHDSPTWNVFNGDFEMWNYFEMHPSFNNMYKQYLYPSLLARLNMLSLTDCVFTVDNITLAAFVEYDTILRARNAARNILQSGAITLRNSIISTINVNDFKAMNKSYVNAILKETIHLTTFHPAVRFDQLTLYWFFKYMQRKYQHLIDISLIFDSLDKPRYLTMYNWYNDPTFINMIRALGQRLTMDELVPGFNFVSDSADINKIKSFERFLAIFDSLCDLNLAAQESTQFLFTVIYHSESVAVIKLVLKYGYNFENVDLNQVFAQRSFYDTKNTVELQHYLKSHQDMIKQQW